MQSYLNKIKIIYKNMNLYHFRINEKIKYLNQILENMMSKLLFRKSMKLQNIYLNQVLFVYKIKIYIIMKILSFYLIYEK